MVGGYVVPPIVSTGAAVMGPVAALSVDVRPFTTTTVGPPAPEAAGSENVVPETVTTPPGVSVVPGAMTKPVAEPMVVAVRVCVPIVSSTGAGVMAAPGARVCETPLTTSTLPEGPRLSVVPETVRAGPPGVRVVPGAMTKAPPGFAVMVAPATVRIGGPVAAEAGTTATVLVPPIMRAEPEGPATTGTPFIVVV